MNAVAAQSLLLGILVDVSFSMTMSIKNENLKNTTRLEGFRDAFKNMIEKAKQIPKTIRGFEARPQLELFALGFGFNNPLSFILGGGGPNVRDSSGLSVAFCSVGSNWLIN